MDNNITIYPTKELKDLIEKESKKQHRAMSGFVLFVLEEYFRKNK